MREKAPAARPRGRGGTSCRPDRRNAPEGLYALIWRVSYVVPYATRPATHLSSASEAILWNASYSPLSPLR